MSLNILMNGIEYTNFTEAQVFRSMEAVSSSFLFTSTADENNIFPVKVGDAIKITADNVSILNGFIEGLSIDYSSDSHAITVTGRNRLGDLVDSTVGAIKEFTGALSLLDIARATLNGINLNNVTIFDETTGIDNFTPTEITSVEIGTSAFEFLELYTRKRQILMTNNGDGDLVFTRASTELFPARLQLRATPDNANNILSARTDIDFSNRYNLYVVDSQLNPINQASGIKPLDIINQQGSAIDGQIRNSRILELNAEESSDSLTSADRAAWEANFRRAKSLNYRPTVQGHSVDGQVWIPNRLIEIDDDFSDIHATLLIKAVRYKYDLDSGSTTELTCTYKDAFTLQAEQNTRDANINEQVSAFTP